VSEVQRRQMTTVLAKKVHNIAIENNFDDCQRRVKARLKDQAFLKGEKRMVAVNSMKWARIMAQIGLLLPCSFTARYVIRSCE